MPAANEVSSPPPIPTSALLPSPTADEMSKLPPAPAVALLPAPLALATTKLPPNPAAALLSVPLALASTKLPATPPAALLPAPLASATSKRPPSPVAALLPVPSANERSPKPVADALAPLPIAIAMSPKPELAVAVLPTVENRSIPLMEICKSSGDVGSAGTARPLSTWSAHENGSADGSAEATCGVGASAAPMPSPTASMPIRPLRIEWLIGLPFPWAHPAGGHSRRSYTGPRMTRNLLPARPAHGCLTQVELRGFVHC